MKLRKKTYRRKSKKGTSKKLYFGKDVHLAIIEYQNCDTRAKKHQIYTGKIKNSFEKLVENLIFIHGFAANQEHFKILKSDCVSFLYETLEKFDRGKGSKAFSYFNVCAKNFLIIRNKKTSKNRKRNISIEEFKNMNATEKHMIENYKILPSQDDIIIREEDKIILKEILGKIKLKVSNHNEKLCIDSIIKVFDNIENLDFLNKRAIFVYLREISGLNPKQLSVAISNIRKYYREIVGNDTLYMLFST